MAQMEIYGVVHTSTIWHCWSGKGLEPNFPFHSNLCAFPEVLKRSICKQSRVS